MEKRIDVSNVEITALELENVLKDLKLEELTEPELRRLAELRKQQLKLASDGEIYGYVPQGDIKGHQLDFHKSGKKIRFIFGGNRSGKSKSSLTECVWYALGTHPFKKVRTPNYGWVVSIDFPASRDVVENEIYRLLPKSKIDNWNKTDRIIKLKNGSTIGFKSCDSGVMKFQGRAMDWIAFDEEPLYDIWQECLMRTIDTSGHLWCAMTPTNGITWVFDEIYENSDPDIEMFQFSMLWNKYLPKDEIEKMIKKMSEDEKDMRIYGKFIQLSGLVYKEFNKNVHIVKGFPIPSDWTKYRTIDHGLNNPTACLWVAVNKEGELYEYDEYYQSERSIKENAEIIKTMSGGDKYAWNTIDPSTQNRDPITKTSIFEEYRNNGIICKAVRHDKIAGINLVKQYLKIDDTTKKPKLFIFDHCYATIKEISRYRWKLWKNNDDKNLSEEPAKLLDHTLDALRYLVSSKPYWIDEEMESYVPEEEPWYGGQYL